MSHHFTISLDRVKKQEMGAEEMAQLVTCLLDKAEVLNSDLQNPYKIKL